MNKQTEEIHDDVAWAELLKCNKNLSIRIDESEAKIKRIIEAIESELKEVPKIQDFASGHGDAQGYARACGQEVMLKRLIAKFSRILQGT